MYKKKSELDNYLFYNLKSKFVAPVAEITKKIKISHFEKIFLSKTSGVILNFFFIDNIKSSDRSTDFFIPSIYLCNYKHNTLLMLVYMYEWVVKGKKKIQKIQPKLVYTFKLL